MARALLCTAPDMKPSKIHAVVRRGAAAIATWLSLTACGPVPYGGARCEAITLETPAAALPLGTAGPVPPESFHQAQPFIEGTGELHCCVVNPYFTPASFVPCDAVDCEALRGRLTVAPVLGEYVDEPCGRQADAFSPKEGVNHCSVYLEGDRIVGVRARCDD